MRWIPDFYEEERPVREVTVSGFWMDSHPVTVAEFRASVDATATSRVPKGA
jgi:formylglycine-generating enzyme required for sulfatase activity